MSDILEIDKLENFPHPRENVKLLGLEATEQLLFDGFMSGKMHHAWIISGQKGIGKATLAYKFAQFILQYKTIENVLTAGLTGLSYNFNAISAQQVRARSHPSLFVLKRAYNDKTKKFGQNINIENVRKAEQFLNKTVEKDGWRVIIIDSADDLNQNSANALLKSIEEPPKNTIFLIVSSLPAKLLPTIRSRCRMLKLPDLSNENIAGLLQSHDVELNPEERDIILFLGQGSFARCLEVIDVDGLEIYKKIVALLYQIPSISRDDIHKLGGELALKAVESKFIFFTEQYLDILTRLIKFVSLGNDADKHFALPNVEIKLFNHLSAHFTLDALFSIWEASERKFRINAAFNMDKKQSIITEFLTLEKAAR
ncbi:MAG: DNA polymerase III subunit delta' [Hyphomicrobiales bacterium]